MDILKELEKYAPHIAIGASIGIPSALVALYYLAPPVPALARLAFEERKLEGEYAGLARVGPLWLEANSIWTSRLLWGKVILVGNYIEIVPDVDGDFVVAWWFENYFDTLKTVRRDYSQTITGLKAGVSSGAVLLNDQDPSSEPYGWWSHFENKGLYDAGLKAGVVYTCKHTAGGTVTSPSGQVFTLATATWTDTMQYKLPPLTATLSFSEKKLT